MILRIFLLIFTLVTLPVKAKEDGFVIANVNNHIITYANLQDRYRYVVSFAKIKVNSPEEKRMLLNQIIDRMIDEELIRQEAAQLKIDLNEQELDEVIASVAKNQHQSLSGLKASLQKNGITFESYKEQIKADLLWSKIVSESLRSKIKITDFEIQEYFEQKKQNTDLTKYRISEILIPNENADSKTLANKLSAELKRGADFKNIVKQFSRSPTVENNGDLGWISQNDVDNKIFATISKLEKNGYSEPVLIADSYYIFKLVDKKSVTHIKEDEMAAAKQRIFTRQLEIESKRYLMDLHKNAFIEVNRAKIAAM